MLRTIKTIVGVCFFGGIVYSQQMPQYSQYLRNQFLVNPGAAGVYDFTDATVGGRMQWVGFTNAPMTSYVSVSTPLGANGPREKYNPGLHLSTGLAKNPEIKTGKLKHAVGTQMIADQYGAFRKINFSGTYAIHLPLVKGFNLSFGTKLGITSNTFLQDRAIVNNPSLDNTYTSYTTNMGNTNIMNLGAGLYLYSKDIFFGIAADQLTRGMVQFGSGTANYDPQIHYSVIGGMKIHLNGDFTITPAFLMQYMQPSPPVIQGTIQAEYKEAIWAAVSYRNKDAVIGMIGMNISNRFKFGYSYDFSVSKFKTYSSGGHELILGIMLGRKG